MEIPLGENQNSDIYNFGFDKNLNRGFEDMSTGTVYDTIENSVNAGSVLSGGNLTLKTLSVGGLVRQVAPGDDIQAAIDAVNREGGGTVQLLAAQYLLKSNIELKEKVTLTGAGRDVTILDFESRGFGIFIKGLSSNILENVQILDLTIQNSNAPAGLEIDYADFWNLQNVRVFSCSQKGIRVQRSRNFYMSNVLSDTNTGYNIEFVSNNNDRSMREFSLVSVFASSGSSDGFNFSLGSGSGGITNFTLIGCHSRGNTGDGFEMPEGSVGTLIGCTAFDNSGKGFALSGSDQCLLGCVANSNTGDGVEVTSGTRQRVIGVSSYANTAKDFDIQPGTQAGQRAVLIGNSHNPSASTVPSDEYNIGNQKIISIGNEGASPVVDKKITRMKNNSGGTIPAGGVGIIDSVATGDNFTTTTTNGDTKVFGMIANTDLGSGDYGNILLEGYTTELLVNNGGSSISIGDWLSTYSHAYYAKKAVTGDMAFAIALEAPTTGTAQIDALLVSPRLI